MCPGQYAETSYCLGLGMLCLEPASKVFLVIHLFLQFKHIQTIVVCQYVIEFSNIKMHE